VNFGLMWVIHAGLKYEWSEFVGHGETLSQRAVKQLKNNVVGLLGY